MLASLVGSQVLASSSPQGTEVLLLLAAGDPWRAPADGLRRGYRLASEQAETCGQSSPALAMAWVPLGSGPAQGLARRPGIRLVIAPVAAPLENYAWLAQHYQWTVVLPLLRGASLGRLAQLRGGDHLWPLLGPRGLAVDRLAQGLLAARLRRVLVVRDGSPGQKALAERFLESLRAAGGTSAGLGPGAPVVDPQQPGALAQLRRDVDWIGPQVLALFTAPRSALAQAVRASPWPAVLTLAWPFAGLEPLANPQIGVDPLGRGEGWPAFARAFQGRWGYGPGLAEAAGYDAGQLAALAAVRVQGQAGWDLGWLHGPGQPLDLCAALATRRRGLAVRPKGAASRLDGAAGSAPSAALRLRSLPPSP